MAFYRFYFIDAQGRFASADDGIFDNDADALAAAEAKRGSYPAVEVWTGSHFVRRLASETGEQSGEAPQR